MNAPARLVLDTNVWLDWLVFNDAGIAPLKSAQAAGEIEIIRHLPGEQELERVLAYKAMKPLVAADLQPAIMTAMRRTSIPHDGSSRAGRVPQCRDADDQTYLELARDCDADLLVTKDRDLLSLRRAKFGLASFRIVTPREGAALLPALAARTRA
jgi:uncharacterized protein